MVVLRRVVAFFALAVSLVAHASFPVPSVYQYQGQEYSTAAAACAAYIAYVQPRNPGNTYSLGNITETASQATCYVNASLGSDSWVDTVPIAKSGGSCPVGASSSGNTCTCMPPYVQGDNTCVMPNPDKEACWNFAVTGTLPGGDLVTEYRYTGTVADGQEFCVPVSGMSSPSKGCKVKFNRDALLNYGDGVSISEGTLSMSPDANTVDQSCDRSPSKDPPPKEKCPNGFSGTVNGEQKCINKVPDSGVGNNDQEETTETESESRRVTRNSTTECKNGTCTTTTTTTTTVTTKPGGATTTSTSTTTTSESQAGFCKQNPGTKICSDGDDKGVGDVGSVTGGKTHGQPTLYETKYPNGIKGVWEDSGIAGADGKFGQLASALMPSIADGNGGCLSFTVPLSVGIVDFGVLDVSPPCLIWPFIRICVLITALWLARALIFGG